MIAQFDHNMRSFAQLQPDSQLLWDDNKFVLQERSFWETFGKIVSNLACCSQDVEEPFCVSRNTVLKIDAFLEATSPMILPSHHEPLRRLKLYLAAYSCQNDQIAPVIRKINALLKTRVCSSFVSLPADLLKIIASYDTSGLGYMHLRQVSSAAHARLPLDLSLRIRFCINPHRQNICRLVDTIAAKSETNLELGIDLLCRYLQQASSKSQKLFWEYVGSRNLKVELKTISDKIESLSSDCSLQSIDSRFLDLNFPNLLSLRCPAARNTAQLVDHCPNLQCLYLKACDLFSESLQAFHFPEKLKALRLKNLHLDLRDAKRLQALGNLEELSCNFHTDEALEAIGEIRTLKKLSVSIRSELTDRLLEIARGLPLLQKLSIFGIECSKQTFNGLRQPAKPILGIESGIKLLKQCPQLVSLEMGQIDPISVEQAEQLNEALKASKIERLCLQLHGEHVARVWPALLQLPHLVILKLWTSCSQMPVVALDQPSPIRKLHFENEEKSSAVKMIAKLNHLTHLTLHSPLDESDIASLRSCPILRTFRYKENFRYIPGHHVLSDRDVERLATNKSIEEIYFTDGSVSCGYEITPEGMLQLLRKNPQLQTLATISPFRTHHFSPREAFALHQRKEY